MCFFFFQAEDGIRDAQESRGLGDVYKRQGFGMSVRLLLVLLPGIACLGSASSHLKYMMFYDDDLPAQHEFINVVSGDGASIPDIIADYQNYHIPGMPTLPSTVFDRSKHGLYPGWAQTTDEFIATMLPLLANGTAMGVFLGDEICCSGVPLSNLTAVADRLRTGLGQSAVLYTNECSVMKDWPAVPFALDYVSIDFYDGHNTDGAREVAQNKQFYTEVIYPKLAPHQGVLFVPGIFASDPAHCARGNVSCPLDSQAEQIVTKLDGFFEWAKNDTRVAGFNLSLIHI
eukprot:TRINITY_DN54829_c0_g2_i2.p1 TRINITY_DN54829_c0_g2~~TRINITY_DN54829_c0_g2_i2.p1  ORF type:complete len:287 (+),score=76.83 TRINITY_DN54829_c0_g2_i2:65-925(+)